MWSGEVTTLEIQMPASSLFLEAVMCQDDPAWWLFCPKEPGEQLAADWPV